MSNILTPTSFAGLKVEKPKQQTPYINMLVYGRSSIGKTTLAGSADAVPEMRKVLFVDVEGGTLSLRKTMYDVDVIRISNWNDFEELYGALLAGDHNYQTVVLDSLTEIQELCMRAIMQAMKADPDNMERDPDVPGMYEWNKSEKQVKKFIRAFRDLPLNVIFTALVKEDKDTKTGVTMKLPDLPGKLAHRVAALFDVVLFFGIDEEGNRVVASSASSNTVAKNRGSSRLPAMLPIPDPEEASAMGLIYPMIVGDAQPLTAAEVYVSENNLEGVAANNQ